jgi:hypothetical protein
MPRPMAEAAIGMATVCNMVDQAGFLQGNV